MIIRFQLNNKQISNCSVKVSFARNQPGSIDISRIEVVEGHVRSKSKEKKYGTGIFIMFVSGSAASTESRNGSYRTGFSRMLLLFL